MDRDLTAWVAALESVVTVLVAKHPDARAILAALDDPKPDQPDVIPIGWDYDFERRYLANIKSLRERLQTALDASDAG